MVSGYPTSTNIPLVDELSTDPRDRGVTQIVALRLPNMGLNVSSGSSRVILCFGYCYSVLTIS